MSFQEQYSSTVGVETSSAQKQPVMLPNAAFEQSPAPAPNMFDDDDDEPSPAATNKTNDKLSKDAKVFIPPSKMVEDLWYLIPNPQLCMTPVP